MPRTKGSRNPQFDARRRELIERLRERLSREGAMHASWRELAAAAGVGLSTLTHYFGRREDVVLAVMQDDLARGVEALAVMSTPSGPFPQSVRDALEHLAAGLRYGVGTMLATGLAEGLRHPTLGPAFIEHSLEPTIQAAKARLDAHVGQGDMRACDTRVAALGLISPMILAFLHQAELSGAERWPLDLDRLMEEHVGAFVRAYSPAPNESAS